jgi:hypothetical protein
VKTADGGLELSDEYNLNSKRRRLPLIDIYHHNIPTMNKGCIDVVVSHTVAPIGVQGTVNALGLREWSIHLYKAIPHVDIALGQYIPQSNRGHEVNDDSHLHTVYQCVGNAHHFLIVEDSNPTPGDRPKECERVADELTDVDMSKAKETLRAVPVDNTSWHYSNQIWVFDALDALFDIGLLPDDHYAQAHILLCEFHQRVEVLNIVV